MRTAAQPALDLLRGHTPTLEHPRDHARSRFELPLGHALKLAEAFRVYLRYAPGGHEGNGDVQAAGEATDSSLGRTQP